MRSTVLVLLMIGFLNVAEAQLAADAKAGLSIFTGSGNSTGLLFGGGIDLPLHQNLFARPEFNLTTHGGTPIELAAVAKLYLPEAKNSLYVDAGLGLWFHSGGSSLGLDFGAGMLFPLTGSRLLIPAEVRIGPVFASGETFMQFALTSGVRFSIN